MEIPNQFREELERRLEEERKAKEKEEQRRKASEEKERKLREEEDSRLEDKLIVCQKVFNWKDEFLKTDEGLSLLGKHYNRLQIYGNGWGHLLKTDDSVACWSDVYVFEDSIKYRHGYKWMPSEEAKFTEPAQMAAYLNHEYLAKLLVHIESGKVFGYILEHNE